LGLAFFFPFFLAGGGAFFLPFLPFLFSFFKAFYRKASY